MNKIHSNANYTAMNNNEKWNGVDFLEVYIVSYHQYFQMVDLLIQYCWQLVNRLNPCALPYVLPQYQEEIKKMSVKYEEKNLKPNVAKNHIMGIQSKDRRSIPIKKGRRTEIIISL